MSVAEIRGLTLRHPWAWAFAKAGKDVENRTWEPSRQGGKVGMFIALHGGSDKVNADYANEIMDALVWMAMQGCEIPKIPPHNLPTVVRPGIVAVGKLVEVRQDSPSPWAARGQYHWCLDVTPLPEPVPHRGAEEGEMKMESETLRKIESLDGNTTLTVPAYWLRNLVIASRTVCGVCNAVVWEAEEHKEHCLIPKMQALLLDAASPSCSAQLAPKTTCRLCGGMDGMHWPHCLAMAGME